MTEELWRLSAVEIAAGIRSQKFSAERVMASVTERIHDCNRDLNAIVYDYSEQAIHEARAADRALTAGERIGPLHGVPVTIKSLVFSDDPRSGQRLDHEHGSENCHSDHDHSRD